MAAKKKTTTKQTKETTAVKGGSSSRRKSTSRTTSVRSRRSVSAKPAQAKVGVLDYFKFGESYTSLILGIVVVIIGAILLVSFFRNNSIRLNNAEQSTSSTSTIENQQQTNGQSTYTVKAGDNLWKIAEAQLHDGYQWIAIAKANNLANPGDIHEGNKLVIPQNVKPIAQVNEPTATPTQAQAQDQQQNAQPTSNKITGSTYVVQHGDDLWDIAVRAYGDGYRWVDIARANNLLNSPNLIFSGNKLTLPRG
jgi:nucleoid-associated protein YgaU